MTRIYIEANGSRMLRAYHGTRQVGYAVATNIGGQVDWVMRVTGQASTTIRTADARVAEAELRTAYALCGGSGTTHPTPTRPPPPPPPPPP